MRKLAHLIKEMVFDVDKSRTNVVIVRIIYPHIAESISKTNEVVIDVIKIYFSKYRVSREIESVVLAQFFG